MYGDFSINEEKRQKRLLFIAHGLEIVLVYEIIDIFIYSYSH